MRSRYQPLLLIYANPAAVPVTTDTAPNTRVMAPGYSLTPGKGKSLLTVLMNISIHGLQSDTCWLTFVKYMCKNILFKMEDNKATDILSRFYKKNKGS